MKKCYQKVYWTTVPTLAALGLLAAGYTSCSQEFVGHSYQKPSNKQTVSPQEPVAGRGTRPTTSPLPYSYGGGGGGDYSGTLRSDIIVPEAIEIEVLESSSESWWRNCLLARSMYSPQWVRVSCNKGAGSDKMVAKLPGIPGLCNAISIRIETYKNIGDACSIRAQQGQPCEGPYPSDPDVITEPSWDATTTSPSKASAFSVYSVQNAQTPDPLIRGNQNWRLPNFVQMGDEMRQWLKQNPRNRWFRFFYEDQPSRAIASARAQPNLADSLGVDYNDYVFDIRSKNIEVGISGTGARCP
jgi:hypothetical protein